MKDFFISYTQADRQWAEWIAWQLEEQGHTTVIQAWDFRPGGNFVMDMQQAAADASRTIAVLSPDYLASKFTQPEWAAAFGKDPTGAKGSLLPVRVRECKLDGLLPNIVYVDLVGRDEESAKLELLNGISRERAKPGKAPAFPGGKAKPLADADRTIKHQPRFPGSLPAVNNVSHRRNLNFTGRKELLEQLRGALTSQQRAAVTQAIHGQGGIGKTQLAIEYLYRHAGEYDVVWWVRCEEPATRTADFAALAVALGLEDKSVADQNVLVMAVQSWLGTNSKWLLILDNVVRPEDIEPILPSALMGHTIITSRDPNWSGFAAPLTVDRFTRRESVDFLLNRKSAGVAGVESSSPQHSRWRWPRPGRTSRPSKSRSATTCGCSASGEPTFGSTNSRPAATKRRSPRRIRWPSTKSTRNWSPPSRC